MKNLINVLDWKDVSLGRDVTGFIEKLKESFSETGFFILKNHPIPQNQIKDNNNVFEDFFKVMSKEQRKKYVFDKLKRQVGYTPMKGETGEFAVIPDNKHFYHVSEALDNPEVHEIPILKATAERLFSSYHSFYKELMQLVALSLELEVSYFDDQVGNSTMRPIHYPASENPTVSDDVVAQGGNALGMCASAHTDINFLTLLLVTEGGLQLKHNGKWVDIQCTADTIIINCGDMLQHLTAEGYKSGVHRVVCQPNLERFSTPFFGHIKRHCSVVPIGNPSKADLEKYPFKTAGEYLDHRIEMILS